MAKTVLASYLKELSGQIGNRIYYNVNGRQFVRSYTKPRNPRTLAQQRNRHTFAESVKIWQGLSPDQKDRYNSIAKEMPVSGYNLFISMHMKGETFTKSKPADDIRVNTVLMPASRQEEVNSVSAPLYLRPGFASVGFDSGRRYIIHKKPFIHAALAS